METTTKREYRIPAKKILSLLKIKGEIISFVTPAKPRKGRKTGDILDKELLIIEQKTDESSHAS